MCASCHKVTPNPSTNDKISSLLENVFELAIKQRFFSGNETTLQCGTARRWLLLVFCLLTRELVLRYIHCCCCFVLFFSFSFFALLPIFLLLPFAFLFTHLVIVSGLFWDTQNFYRKHYILFFISIKYLFELEQISNTFHTGQYKKSNFFFNNKN